MSRTYRRRQEKFYWTREEWDSFYSGWYRSNKTYDAAVAIYYSDAEQTMLQVPKWFKVEHWRRPLRTATKRALKKEMQSIEYGDVVYPIKKQFSEYYW